MTRAHPFPPRVQPLSPPHSRVYEHRCRRWAYLDWYVAACTLGRIRLSVQPTRVGKPPTRWYRCPECDKYHLGSRPVKADRR